MAVDFEMKDFFPCLDGFAHKDIFAGIEIPWDVLKRITGYVEGRFLDETADRLPDGVKIMRGPGEDAMLFCDKPLMLEDDLVCASLKIRVGAGTRIEPTAVIKGNTIIGNGCEIRHGAYLRGTMITGDHCTLGHTTEIKNTIIMNHSECGHFNYIGDSVVGSYVNFGAGTKIANLKFRTPEAKEKVSFPEIKLIHNGRPLKTGVSKLGAIVGDYVELGCNCVTNPAVFLAAKCMVYPNVNVQSGYYKAGTVIRP